MNSLASKARGGKEEIAPRSAPPETSSAILWQFPSLMDAPRYARCRSCGRRFPWPAGVAPEIDPLCTTQVACPGCHLIIYLAPEPLDETWWMRITSSDAKPTRQEAPGQQSPSRRHHQLRRPTEAKPVAPFRGAFRE